MSSVRSEQPVQLVKEIDFTTDSNGFIRGKMDAKELKTKEQRDLFTQKFNEFIASQEKLDDAKKAEEDSKRSKPVRKNKGEIQNIAHTFALVVNNLSVFDTDKMEWLFKLLKKIAKKTIFRFNFLELNDLYLEFNREEIASLLQEQLKDVYHFNYTASEATTNNEKEFFYKHVKQVVQRNISIPRLFEGSQKKIKPPKTAGSSAAASDSSASSASSSSSSSSSASVEKKAESSQSMDDIEMASVFPQDSASSAQSSTASSSSSSASPSENMRMTDESKNSNEKRIYEIRRISLDTDDAGKIAVLVLKNTEEKGIYLPLADLILFHLLGRSDGKSTKNFIEFYEKVTKHNITRTKIHSLQGDDANALCTSTNQNPLYFKFEDAITFLTNCSTYPELSSRVSHKGMENANNFLLILKGFNADPNNYERYPVWNAADADAKRSAFDERKKRASSKKDVSSTSSSRKKSTQVRKNKRAAAAPLLDQEDVEMLSAQQLNVSSSSSSSSSSSATSPSPFPTNALAIAALLQAAETPALSPHRQNDMSSSSSNGASLDDLSALAVQARSPMEMASSHSSSALSNSQSPLSVASEQSAQSLSASSSSDQKPKVNARRIRSGWVADNYSSILPSSEMSDEKSASKEKENGKRKKPSTHNDSSDDNSASKRPRRAKPNETDAREEVRPMSLVNINNSALHVQPGPAAQSQSSTVAIASAPASNGSSSLSMSASHSSASDNDVIMQAEPRERKASEPSVSRASSSSAVPARPALISPLQEKVQGCVIEFVKGQFFPDIENTPDRKFLVNAFKTHIKLTDSDRIVLRMIHEICLCVMSVLINSNKKYSVKASHEQDGSSEEVLFPGNFARLGTAVLKICLNENYLAGLRQQLGQGNSIARIEFVIRNAVIKQWNSQTLTDGSVPQCPDCSPLYQPEFIQWCCQALGKSLAAQNGNANPFAAAPHQVSSSSSALQSSSSSHASRPSGISSAPAERRPTNFSLANSSAQPSSLSASRLFSRRSPSLVNSASVPTAQSIQPVLAEKVLSSSSSSSNSSSAPTSNGGSVLSLMQNGSAAPEPTIDEAITELMELTDALEVLRDKLHQETKKDRDTFSPQLEEGKPVDTLPILKERIRKETDQIKAAITQHKHKLGIYNALAKKAYKMAAPLPAASSSSSQAGNGSSLPRPGGGSSS